MGFESLTVAVPGGEIFATRRDGDGPPALVLHGGPGIGAESMVGLIETLDGVFETALPQQRGLEPSTLEGPRDVETHVADAIAVLDQLGWQRAWLIGHAWGGHLAMHLAVAHPDRVAGLITFETLGAVPDGGAAALVEAMVARLSPDERAQLDSLVARQTAGDDDPTLVGQILMTLWPSYGFVHGTLPPPVSLRLEESIPGEPDTMASVRAHFEAGTLERGLPLLSVPALLVHGAGDPMPLTATTDTAALIPGATVVIIEEAGHVPWVEQPAAVRAAVEGFIAETQSRSLDQGIDPASRGHARRGLASDSPCGCPAPTMPNCTTSSALPRIAQRCWGRRSSCASSSWTAMVTSSCG